MHKATTTTDCPAYKMPRLALKIREWRELFREEEYKLIIAKMLNHYLSEVNSNKNRPCSIYFNGYLINKTSIYLVLDIDHKIKASSKDQTDIHRKIIQNLISNLDKNVKATIESIHGANILNRGLIKNGDNNTLQVAALQLFEEFPFNNYPLLKLITGYKEESSYYDTRLVRLKNRINNERFCSAIFYAAEVCTGPVRVGRKDNENCFDENR
jgi:hypothetical protein